MVSYSERTAWTTASTSLLVIERIASRSLMSLRPMISSLVEAMTLLSLLRSGGDEPGQHECVHQATGGRLVGQVDVVGRAGGVRQHDPDAPLGGAQGIVARSQRPRNGA